MRASGNVGKLGAMIILVTVALAGCATPGQDGNETDQLQSRIDSLETKVQDLQQRVDDLKAKVGPETGLNVAVQQEPGKTVYWVTPGPRRLSPMVFGTQGSPRTTGMWQIRALNASDQPGSDAMAKILEERLPFLVGAPVPARKSVDGGQIFAAPTPFSDKGVPGVEGELDLLYKDRQPSDAGSPVQTADEARLNVSFTDPQGNSYRIELVTLFQPPIPGYETAGGVMTNAWHHGLTGTGSPLMPRAYTYGALWGLGNVYVNGSLAEERHFFHFMTTAVVRNGTYHLMTDEQMPVPPSEAPVPGQQHHTHGIVIPMEIPEQGPPRFDPVDTAFTLPNGKRQPFIHIMFEEDCITAGPYTDDSC